MTVGEVALTLRLTQHVPSPRGGELVLRGPSHLALRLHELGGVHRDDGQAQEGQHVHDEGDCVEHHELVFAADEAWMG